MKKFFYLFICIFAMSNVNAEEKQVPEEEAAYWIWYDSSRAHKRRQAPDITTADFCLNGAFNSAEIQHCQVQKLNPDKENKITKLHIAALTGNLSDLKENEIKSLVKVQDASGRTPIFYAKDRKTIKKLLKYDKEAYKHTDKYGFTPLFMARNLDCAKCLLEEGCSVTARSELENTPLHITGNVDIAKELLKQGEDLDLDLLIAENNAGQTPLHIQIKYEDKSKIVTMLIEKMHLSKNLSKKDKAGNTVLHYVTQFDLAEWLINREKNLVNAANEKGETPIFTTADTKIGDLLLKNDCKTNIRNSDDQTPLHVTKNAEMVKFLADYIDINSKTEYGFTPLHLAKNYEVAEALIEKGAELNEKTKNGVTPLHRHVKEGNKDIASLLIEKGADVNIKTEHGFTPIFDVRDPELAKKIAAKADPSIKVHGGNWNALHWHIEMADYPNNKVRETVVRAIIEARPQMVKTSTKYNYTPLHHVSELDTVKALIKEGADINASAKDGTTPLHSHIKRGNYNIVRHLIEQKGIELNLKDNEGHTPKFYCKDLNFKRVLKDKGAKEE